MESVCLLPWQFYIYSWFWESSFWTFESWILLRTLSFQRILFILNLCRMDFESYFTVFGDEICIYPWEILFVDMSSSACAFWRVIHNFKSFCALIGGNNCACLWEFIYSDISSSACAWGGFWVFLYNYGEWDLYISLRTYVLRYIER